MTTHHEDRAARLRIAAVLLAPRDSEGVVRAPLPDTEALASIRAMRTPQRAALTSQINWVRDYEANDTPELVRSQEFLNA